MTYRPNPRAKPPAETPAETPVESSVESSTEQSGQIAQLQSELSEVLHHLRNISRTMTMMRRMMWFFVFISVLSAISLGYYMMKAKKQTEGIFQALEQIERPQPQRHGQLNLQELLDALK